MTNALIIALLLQAVPLPPRTAIENPASVSEVPKKLQKDYDKLWNRFVGGNEDSKVVKDADKILKKDRTFVPLITLEAYIDLYRQDIAAAETKFYQVLSYQPMNRIALSYLGDLAFARQDYARAGDIYARLLESDPRRVDVEPKRQKAFLLATENLIRNATQAEQDNRMDEAESLYLQALKIAPREPSLHGRLGALYSKRGKWDEALAEFQKQRQFGGGNEETDRQIAEALANLGRTDEARIILDRLRQTGIGNDDGLESKINELEDIGRWGKDVAIFREIQAAPQLNREQLAALIVRYFPQLMEFRRNAQVVTDIQDSWARPEIQVVTGIGILDPLPNHTFQPAAPVTRGELAVALGRLTRFLSVPAPSAPSIPTTDLSPTHALYREVQLVVAHGLMTLDDAGAFNISGPVSGENGVRAVGILLDRTRGKQK
jgi:tetratricopeptide (TPR) repeat protein